MKIADVVRAIVYGYWEHDVNVETFDDLVRAVHCELPDAEASEIDVAARPYQAGRSGAYYYEREDGPGHCPCQSYVEDIGPEHLASCPWSDPDYPTNPF